MPKQKITREMVLEAAFAIAREQGPEQVLVKAIAQRLGCSVQPIYSYCDNMESLRSDLSQMAGAFLGQYLAEHVDRDHLFRSTGDAYLRFAKEEPHLFRLYFFRRRPPASSLAELCAQESNPRMAAFLQSSLGLSEADARALHLHMTIYTMGLSFLLSASGGTLSLGELQSQMEAAYGAFAGQGGLPMLNDNQKGETQ